MSTDSAEESVTNANVPHMEINISNTNISGQIVLNDVLLMEMICRYPFLIIPEVEPQLDVDYNAWGWDQLAKSFNQKYEGVELSAPFSVSDLRLRWVKLRPLISALASATGQIPDPLWRVMNNVHNRMQAEKPPDVPKTKCQDFLLSQLTFMKSLSQSERRRLEVEVLDLILEQERLEKATQELGPKELETAQSEYDEFLKAIRVKELPADTLLRSTIDAFRISPHSNPSIINANKRSVGSSRTISDNGIRNGSIDVEIKTEVADEPENKDVSKFDKRPTETPRYVPLKSAKYYIKSCRIRVKRVDFEDLLPSVRIRRSRRPTLRT
ncbi:uncharacterized protein LOC120446185 [Drosophila santomea]|uniref:uncharacterized protein LOC120446185 n=1 Tax=Drosophila santomea TaxID=129105 RepID=UPI001952FDD2|nr:uncharacterized protein LOC120446185 [Drosophila santomea]